MTDLKRSIFVQYADKSEFQFTRIEANRWMVHVTSAPPKSIRWLRSDEVDDNFVETAIASASCSSIEYLRTHASICYIGSGERSRRERDVHHDVTTNESRA